MGPSDPSEDTRLFAGAPITFALLLLNLAVFAAEAIQARSAPLLGEFPRGVILAFGANYPPLTFGLHQVERLVASGFAHASILHIAINLGALAQIGPYTEREVGSARYAVLYVVTTTAASFASLFWQLLRGTSLPSQGASGAICGVLAAALVISFRLEGWRSWMAFQIGFWLILIVIYGARVQGADSGAHIGGMAMGGLVAFLWERGVEYSRRATIGSIVGSAAVCLLAGSVVLWRNLTDPYADLDANDRSALVTRAIGTYDCEAAWRALAATEAVTDPSPELEGLQTMVRLRCGRRSAETKP